jgi:type IV secretion system protein VirB5
MKMKKILLGVTLSALLSSAAFAQIPVTVTTQVSDSPMTIANFAKEVASWKMQYEQMVSQINQAKQQYESLTGARGLGTIMNNPALRDYLPNDWQGVYDSVRSGGYSGLSGTAKSVYNANKMFDSCALVTQGEQRTACEARAVKASQDKGFALDAYDKAKGRINQIDQLMSKINDTSDPKAIAELQGRIAAEQANIQNEQTKLQLYAMVAAAEDKIQAQRQREIQAKTWAAKKVIQVQPITFN